jgi:glycerol uptake facilitator-like aquaporin
VSAELAPCSHSLEAFRCLRQSSNIIQHPNGLMLSLCPSNNGQGPQQDFLSDLVLLILLVLLSLCWGSNEGTPSFSTIPLLIIALFFIVIVIVTVLALVVNVMEFFGGCKS